MTSDSSTQEIPTRPLRRDAQRNRDHLIATAREVFSAGELNLRMEDLARRAGVGVGTLYRHFETREALIEAVYRQEIETLCASAVRLLDTLPADQALSAFLNHLIQHVVSNQGLASALGSALGGPPSGAEQQTGPETLLDALTLLMRAGAAAGLLRADVAPQTVLLVLGGLCLTLGQPHWEQQARAVVALMLDGLKPVSPT